MPNRAKIKLPLRSALFAHLMLKIANFFFNLGLFVLLIFVSLCWALENVDIWVRYILLPFLLTTTLLGCLFKHLGKNRGEKEPRPKDSTESDFKESP